MQRKQKYVHFKSTDKPALCGVCDTVQAAEINGIVNPK
jgi:hypothetical protein